MVRCEFKDRHQKGIMSLKDIEVTTCSKFVKIKASRVQKRLNYMLKFCLPF